MTQTDIPKEVVEYARSYMENFEYADRLRMACKGDSQSEQQYLAIMRLGCCGYEDYVKYPFLIDGKEYYFGFNFGH